MRERAKNRARTKKARGKRGEGDKEKEKWRIVKICAAAVGCLSILIGQFWLFRQQVSRHDGISIFRRHTVSRTF